LLFFKPLTKTIRRVYTLGVPLAFKLGAFDKHVYFLAGGEYELAFHYRARKWLSNSRDGTKYVDGEWFSKKSRRFVPSVFAGFQLSDYTGAERDFTRAIELK